MVALSHSRLEQIKGLVREAAEKAIGMVLANLGDEHVGKGAYLRIYHLPKIEEGYTGLIELFAEWVGGNTNSNKIDKYMIVSVEKAIRLAEYARVRGDISSWESRDPKRNRFGGAILILCLAYELELGPTHLLFTISGLPEKGDETVILLTATSLLPWETSKRDIARIIARSGNELANKMLDKFLFPE